MNTEELKTEIKRLEDGLKVMFIEDAEFLLKGWDVDSWAVNAEIIRTSTRLDELYIELLNKGKGRVQDGMCIEAKNIVNDINEDIQKILNSNFIEPKVEEITVDKTLELLDSLNETNKYIDFTTKKYLNRGKKSYYLKHSSLEVEGLDYGFEYLKSINNKTKIREDLFKTAKEKVKQYIESNATLNMYYIEDESKEEGLVKTLYINSYDIMNGVKREDLEIRFSNKKLTY